MQQFVSRYFLIILFLISGISTAQTSLKKRTTILKVNTATLLLAMPNIAVESQLSTQYSLQFSTFISPWKSISGNHLQAYLGFLEARYYFKEFGKSWFAGPNIGSGIYDITKWDYWNKGRYQRGYSLFLGITGGYAWEWKNNIGLEAFVTIGSSQGFYHGYQYTDKGVIRYENTSKRWNRSGEWIPYQGGLMITRKF